MLNTPYLKEFIKMAHHGSPYDRGSADRYYGRAFNPHHRLNGDEVTDLTPEQIAEYRAGWNEETESKDWGHEKNPYVELSRRIFLNNK